ncbi:MAG: hypothetical protein AAF739_17625 [Pseudomonadota bacterium]
MITIAEVDADFFDDYKKGPRRIYLSFDKEGCRYLIETLEKYEETGSRASTKLMSEAWGVGPLPSDNYYQGAIVPEILELALIK